MVVEGTVGTDPEGADVRRRLGPGGFPERDWILAELAQKEIVVNVSYPWPIHLMRGYAFLGYCEGDLPQTEAVARAIFSLPMCPTLKEEEQDRVCEVLWKTLKQG